MPAEYLDVLKDLIAANKIRPVVDRVYPFTETADALRYVNIRIFLKLQMAATNLG